MVERGQLLLGVGPGEDHGRPIQVGVASAVITGQELRIDSGMTAGIGGPLFTLTAEKAGL